MPACVVLVLHVLQELNMETFLAMSKNSDELAKEVVQVRTRILKRQRQQAYIQRQKSEDRHPHPESEHSNRLVKTYMLIQTRYVFQTLGPPCNRDPPLHG
jgi:hypothetical protein